jgi:hypothetical protein
VAPIDEISVREGGSNVPTALRTMRDAIVRWFVMGYRGLVACRCSEAGNTG